MSIKMPESIEVCIPSFCRAFEASFTVREWSKSPIGNTKLLWSTSGGIRGNKHPAQSTVFCIELPQDDLLLVDVAISIVDFGV
jgi:hypothetical protein